MQRRILEHDPAVELGRDPAAMRHAQVFGPDALHLRDKAPGNQHRLVEIGLHPLENPPVLLVGVELLDSPAQQLPGLLIQRKPLQPRGLRPVQVELVPRGGPLEDDGLYLVGEHVVAFGTPQLA